MGNREILHDDDSRIVRPWAHRAWGTCLLEFNGVKRPKPFSEGNYLEVAVLVVTVHVVLDNDRLHVAVQDLARHAAECGEGAFVAADQRGHLHVADELDVTGPAISIVAQNACSGAAPLRNSTQSTRNCSPIAVSKRTSGSTGRTGRIERLGCFAKRR